MFLKIRNNNWNFLSYCYSFIRRRRRKFSNWKLKEGGYGKFNVSINKNNTKFRNKYFFTPNLINSLVQTNKFKNISPDVAENVLISINNFV